jgi:hypothetical protein
VTDQKEGSMSETAVKIDAIIVSEIAASAMIASRKQSCCPDHNRKGLAAALIAAAADPKLGQLPIADLVKAAHEAIDEVAKIYVANGAK